MNETSEKAKRPTSITVICVVGFIGALLAIPLIFSPISQQIGAWYPPYLGLSVVVGIATTAKMNISEFEKVGLDLEDRIKHLYSLINNWNS